MRYKGENYHSDYLWSRDHLTFLIDCLRGRKEVPQDILVEMYDFARNAPL